MKIKKTFQGELPENRVVNAKSNSATDAYSANYLNDKLRNVVVSPTEPTTGEEVWIKRSSNILKFSDFTKEVNGITFKMKDQVLSIKGTATAYTQECYMPIKKTLEEDMTLTQYTSGKADGLVAKAAYTDNGTSYYPNLFSVELNKGAYIDQLYFIISEGSVIDAEVRFQLERGKGTHDWQPVMEKQVFVKNDNGVYEELVKKNLHVGIDEPKNGEDVWIKKSNNLFPGWNVGRHYGSSNGVLTFDTDNSSTDLIPVDFTTNNKYTFSNFPTSSNIYISAFDSKGVYIGRTSSGVKSEYTFTPDKLSSSGAGSGDANDIKYIAVTYQGTDVTNNTMLNMGGDVLPYEERVNTEILTRNDNGVYEGIYKKLNNERHIMYAYVSAETDIVTGADQRAKVPLNKFEFVGTKLSFNADKKSIIIGKGVSKIAIRGILSYKDDLGSVPIALNLFHNGSSLTQRFETTSSSTRSFALIESELPILSVSEGDIISLVLRTVATTGKTVHIYDGKSSSMLCVEVLE